ELAIARHDVERRASLYSPYVNRREGHVVVVVVAALGAITLRHAAQECDDLARDLDGVHALGRQRRVRFEAANAAGVRSLALVGDDELHARGFAHDAAAWLVADV